jgi:hypothetical protein
MNHTKTVLYSHIEVALLLSGSYSLVSVMSLTGGSGSNPGLVKWDLWWTKWRWGRFSPSTSVSPANLNSTKILHRHNHPGQVQ